MWRLRWHADRGLSAEKNNFPTDLYMVEVRMCSCNVLHLLVHCGRTITSSILQGLAQMLGQGHKLQLLDNMADYDAALSEDVAVVMLTQVHSLSECMQALGACDCFVQLHVMVQVSFQTGRLLDMRRMTEAAHAK